MSVRLAGHIASRVREQRESRKSGESVDSKSLSSVPYFLQQFSAI